MAADTAEQGLRQALLASSERVAEAFGEEGGAPVLQEIAERFHPDQVRFVAASATSKMPLVPDPEPGDTVWDEPEPNGTALALLHILEMLGIFRDEAPVGRTTQAPT